MGTLAILFWRNHKMKQVTLSLLMFILFGCAEIFQLNAPKSDWIELSNTEKLKCEPWPKAPKSIEDIEFSVIQDPYGEKAHFLVETKMRTGRTKNFYYEFKGNLDIEKEMVKEIVMDSEGLAIIGQTTPNGELVTLNQDEKKQEAKIEFRYPKTNVLRHTSNSIKGIDFSSGQIVFADKTAILILENDSIHLYSGKLSEGKITKWEKISKIKVSEDAKVIQDNHKNTFLVDLKKVAKAGSDQGSYVLEFYRLTPDLQTTPYRLNLNTQDQVESWDVKSGHDNMFAMLEGDSLVGQVKLTAAKLDLSGTPSMVEPAQLDINDIHLSKPFWGNAGPSASLLILKWVDIEGTIGMYKIDANGSIIHKNYGIIPEGGAIVDAFELTKHDEIFTIIRYKDDTHMRYKICQIDNEW